MRRPFVGNAGKQLDWLLTRAKLDRRGIWITNAGLCMPAPILRDSARGIWLGKTETLRESTQKYCRDRLHQELAEVSPKVVLACGNYALESLLGVQGILARHGALFPIDLQHLAGRREKPDLSPDARSYVIPMLHPAHLLRGESRKTRGVLDVLAKAKRVALEGPQEPSKLFTVTPFNPRGDAVIDEFERWADLFIQDGSDIAIDVETSMDDARHATLTVIGFGSAKFDIGIAVSVLAWDREKQTYYRCWRADQWARVERIILRLLRSSLIKWFWNMNFDVIVIDRYWPDQMRGPLRDGIHYHWLYQPDMPHGLAWSCQSLLDIPAWKLDFWKKQDAGEATDHDLLVYNAQDAVYTMRIAPILEERVIPSGNAHLLDHQLRVTKLAKEAHEIGIPVDGSAWLKLHGEMTTKQGLALAAMHGSIKDDLPALAASVQRQREDKLGREVDLEPIELKEFNPRSEYHARWYLYEHLGLPVTLYTEGGKDKDPNKMLPTKSYKGVLDHMKQPLVKAFVDWGEHDYHLGRLRDDFRDKVDPATGRLHPSWNITPAGTRWKASPNVQNLDKWLKKILAAPPGWCWVGADAAQLEMRILACLAGITRLLDIFNLPPYDEKAEHWKKLDPAWDSHALVATLVYGARYTNSSADDKDKLRTLVKRVVYGMNYGAFPKKIRAALLQDKRLTSDLRAELSLKRVTTIFSGFHANFPEVKRWASAEMTKVQLSGIQVIPPFGRRRPWPVLELEEPKIRNTPVQIAAGDIMNLLFCNMQDEVHERKLRSHMVIHGHDACYWLTRKDDALAMKELIDRRFVFDMYGPAGPVHIWGQASIGATPADVA